MRRSPEQTRPEYRHLRIFAIDPMVARGGEHRATVQLRFEELERRDASFFGRRIEVADVDTSGQEAVWLEPVDLDSAHIAMQHGLEPSESDPQFHQQMVYAVAMRTLEQFDRALGRMIYFKSRRRLRLVPHAFRGANAFYHPKLRAVLFGYFRASDESPGENLPGQTIFTCLSHDIVAHEVTHAIVDRLRPHFNIATNPHVRAFHEAFADIVAVFQRLTFRDLVQQALQEARGKLANSARLTEIAAQFGQGLGSGAALRTALCSTKRIQDVEEEHDLGEVLLAAIFDGFQTTFDRRSADLIRIATGGSGILPEGALHPDLVARLTAECVRTAQGVLTMCIRAFDYLPPADVDFGAFLRALVTADWELNPLDESGLRAAIIEGCRRRGIFAMDAGSLAVSALLLDSPPREAWSDHEPEFQKWVDLAVQIGAQQQRSDTREDDDEADLFSSGERASDSKQQAPEVVSSGSGDSADREVPAQKQLRAAILAWFAGLDAEKRAELRLSAGDLGTVGFHGSHRVTADGTLRFGLVVQLVQMTPVTLASGEAMSFPTGATLVIGVNGKLRFLIRTKAPNTRKADLERAAALATTNALGWRLHGAGRDPFAVDYRGMHEGRPR